MINWIKALFTRKPKLFPVATYKLHIITKNTDCYVPTVEDRIDNLSSMSNGRFKIYLTRSDGSIIYSNHDIIIIEEPTKIEITKIGGYYWDCVDSITYEYMIAINFLTERPYENDSITLSIEDFLMEIDRCVDGNYAHALINNNNSEYEFGRVADIDYKVCFNLTKFIQWITYIQNCNNKTSNDYLIFNNKIVEKISLISKY